MKTIKVLLLDDMEDDFAKTEAVIENLNNTLQSKTIHLELLYDFTDARKLISNFVASETMPLHLQKPHKDVVEEMVKQIKENKDLLCILDIVWGADVAKKAKKPRSEIDQHGCDFFGRYLNENKIRTNTIIVSALDKAPEKMGTITHVTKVTKGDDNFRNVLMDKICALPIISIKRTRTRPDLT
jgi:hypothetical protein